MTWLYFYLLCFLVGFTLSVLSFLAGAVHFHLPFHLHLPFHGVHHVGGLSGAGHAHGVAFKGGGMKSGAMKSGGQLSWLDASTILAFLAWFGGVGYILTKHSHFVAMAILGFALLAGLFAGTVVFQFMARMVKATSGQMLDWDYRVEGTVGTVSMAIRENKIGEVIFEQNGARKSAGARSEDGKSLPAGTEVVIARYDDGIAYVKRWEEFTK
jgi:membrane protein implicated in regulation of membrane protease activity